MMLVERSKESSQIRAWISERETTLPRRRRSSSKSAPSRTVSRTVSLAADDLARLRLVGQVVEDERPGLRDLGAAQQGADPREQLAEREGLDEIVVGAGVEPLDLVLDGVARRQHQDLRAHAAGAQLAAELEAVARAGQQQVEDDEIRSGRADALQRRVGVAGDVDGVALLGQALLEELGDPLLVLDDENLHDDVLLRTAVPPGPRAFRNERTKTDAGSGREARRERRGRLAAATTATTAPTASRPKRRGRDTAIGGTLGIIGGSARIL